MPKKRKVRKPVKKAIKIKKQTDLTFFRIIATRLFGDLIDKKFKKYFENLRKPFDSSDLDMMFRTYLAVLFLIAVGTFSLTFIITLIFMLIFKVTLFHSILALLIFPSLATILVFLYMYAYPEMRAGSRRASIEANLPFAINHMAAIAESGASPYAMFKVLSKFKEYGAISKEAETIFRNMDFFGLSEIAALRDVVSKSPSKDFSEFLEGFSTTIQTGGDLKKFLREESKEAMFNYRINRDKYNQTIAVYADMYTALLIAAPLILIAILAILNTIGGTVFGLPIDIIIKLGIYALIPLLNTMFLMFLQLTQPAV
jgi:flagellar protein FlaJ